MTKKNASDYRIRIRDPHTISRETFQHTYIVRKGGDVSYMASDETPLALANLILKDAAEVRFALEDARDGNAAALVLRDALAARFVNNKALLPVVDVL